MKMKFAEDKFYDGNLIYEANKIYEVDEANGWAGRWLKRGGIVVKDEEVKPVPVEPELDAAPPIIPETNKIEMVHTTEEVSKKRSPGRPKKVFSFEPKEIL